MALTCPATASFRARPAPLYGTCSRSIFASIMKFSMLTCPSEPAPGKRSCTCQVGLGQCDELLHGLGRHARMHGKHAGDGHDIGDRREVLDRVVARAGEYRRIRAMGADRRHADGVAVRRRPGDLLHAERASRAPLFSTTTDWPSSRPAYSETRRAIRSVDPPAANGTTNLMGRLGYLSCASAEAAGSAAAATAATAKAGQDESPAWRTGSVHGISPWLFPD